MKSVLSFAFMIATLGIFSYLSQSSAPDPLSEGAIIETDKITHDFGTIEQNGNGTCEFKVFNRGTEPLLISSCQGSCSCTVPQYPKEPIAPGESAVILVKYNTARIGPFNKSVRIFSNASNYAMLEVFIKGNVTAPTVVSPEKNTEE